MRSAAKNETAAINAPISVANIAHHIPSTSNKNGRRNTNVIWKTNALKNDSIAETSPLLSAVKNPDEYMFMPEKINANEKQITFSIGKKQIRFTVKSFG